MAAWTGSWSRRWRRVEAAHFDAAAPRATTHALARSAERERLAACLAALESFDVRRAHIPAQTAFWINVFNAVVLRDAPEMTGAGSVRDVEGFFERPRVKVGAHGYSLDDIEHGLLRGNVPKYGKYAAADEASRPAPRLRAARFRRAPPFRAVQRVPLLAAAARAPRPSASTSSSKRRRAPTCERRCA